jgi:hypothetical protein
MMNSTLYTQHPAQSPWPDPLQPPDPVRVEQVLEEFWRRLALLPDLVRRGEHLLAEELTAHLRGILLEMMLALNGIRRPLQTTHLNSYLSPSQRTAIQKALTLPDVSSESWIGRAVALVVIYRWYAPQLVARFDLPYPQALEEETLARLQQTLADWPLVISTE